MSMFEYFHNVWQDIFTFSIYIFSVQRYLKSAKAQVLSKKLRAAIVFWSCLSEQMYVLGDAIASKSGPQGQLQVKD